MGIVDNSVHGTELMSWYMLLFTNERSAAFTEVYIKKLIISVDTWIGS